jgi:hypothetical protein
MKVKQLYFFAIIFLWTERISSKGKNFREWYSRQHRFAAIGAKGKIMSFLFIIEQHFQAEKSLLSDRINNEHFIIKLATDFYHKNKTILS